jgi:hypothetical protein
LNSQNFSRREIHVIAFAVLFMAALVIFKIDQATLNHYELIGIFGVALPLGIYIMTDPERK